jgi:hypothetical protein
VDSFYYLTCGAAVEGVSCFRTVRRLLKIINVKECNSLAYFKFYYYLATMMRKINIPTEGVVIGSRTIAEYKLQVLNFMNMLYDIAFNGANRENINPWTNNLKFEVKRLKWELNKLYGSPIEGEIDIMSNKIKDKTIKEKDWLRVLEILTEAFDLKYTLN